MTSVLLFLHIPKTGGTTLNRVLKRQFPEDAVHSVFSSRDVQELQRMPRQEREQLKYVHGHFPFGIHEHFDRECRYISLLRDPVDRLISLYRFTLIEELSPYYEKMTDHSFRSYLKVLPPHILDNAMTRYLSGQGVRNPDVTVTRSLHKQAIHHVDTHFGPIGTVRQFNRLLYLLKHVYNWNWIYYIRRNVSRTKVNVTIGDAARAYVRKKNQYDTELVGYVQKWFNNNFQRLPGSIRSNAQNFDRQNTLMNSVINQLRPLRNFAFPRSP